MSIFKKPIGQEDDNGETPEFEAFLEGRMEGYDSRSRHIRCLTFWPRGAMGFCTRQLVG